MCDEDGRCGGQAHWRKININMSYNHNAIPTYIHIVILSQCHTYLYSYSPVEGGTAPQIKVEHVLCTVSKLSRFFFLSKMISIDDANCLRNVEIWHYYKFSWPNGNSWVIDQDNNLHVLINSSRIAWPTKTSMPFLSFSDNLLLKIILFKTKKNNNNFEKAYTKHTQLRFVPFSYMQQSSLTVPNCDKLRKDRGSNLGSHRRQKMLESAK